MTIGTVRGGGTPFFFNITSTVRHVLRFYFYFSPFAEIEEQSNIEICTNLTSLSLRVNVKGSCPPR